MPRFEEKVCGEYGTLLIDFRKQCVVMSGLTGFSQDDMGPKAVLDFLSRDRPEHLQALGVAIFEGAEGNVTQLCLYDKQQWLDNVYGPVKE
jgi:hypothetical protein